MVTRAWWLEVHCPNNPLYLRRHPASHSKMVGIINRPKGVDDAYAVAYFNSQRTPFLDIEPHYGRKAIAIIQLVIRSREDHPHSRGEHFATVSSAEVNGGSIPLRPENIETQRLIALHSLSKSESSDHSAASTSFQWYCVLGHIFTRYCRKVPTMTATHSTNKLVTTDTSTPTATSTPAPIATTHPPRNTRRTRHSSHPHHPGSNTRADLLAAASTLIADGGFSATTPRNIAELTGLASGAVTREFGTHGELLAATFQRIAAYELAVVSHASYMRKGTSADQLVTLIEAFTSRALRGMRTAEALLFEPVCARVNQERLTYRRQYHSLINGIITKGIASGEFPTQHSATSARAVTGAVMESFLGRLSPIGRTPTNTKGEEDAALFTQNVTELVLRLVSSHR